MEAGRKDISALKTAPGYVTFSILEDGVRLSNICQTVLAPSVIKVRLFNCYISPVHIDQGSSTGRGKDSEKFSDFGFLNTTRLRFCNRFFVAVYPMMCIVYVYELFR